MQDLQALVAAVEQACRDFEVSWGAARPNRLAPATRQEPSPVRPLCARPARPQNPATRPAAEATLLEFRSSPQAFAAAQLILQHSGDVQAQFQVPRGWALGRWGAGGAAPGRGPKYFLKDLFSWVQSSEVMTCRARFLKWKHKLRGSWARMQGIASLLALSLLLTSLRQWKPQSKRWLRQSQF